MAFLAGALAVGALATSLIIFALGDATLYFYTPSEAKARQVPQGQAFNLGGLVAAGSIVHSKGLEVHFKVTDGDDEVLVSYDKDLPDLFREGQGVVVTGAFSADGSFVASNVLAKHDETYMPPEVARALKEKGMWEAGKAKP